MVTSNITQTNTMIRTTATWVAEHSEIKNTVREKKDKPW